jgi:hypothetical protein
MDCTKNCFFKFEECGKDDANSIFNRTNHLNITKMSKHMNDIDKSHHQNSTTKHTETILSIKNFDNEYLKSYKGDLYNIANLLNKCLKTITIDFDNKSLDNYYKTFLDLWTQFELRGQLRYKIQVQHQTIKMLKTIYLNHKHLLNEDIIEQIKSFHYYYQQKNIYKNIKRFYYSNKINGYDMTDLVTVDNKYDYSNDKSYKNTIDIGEDELYKNMVTIIDDFTNYISVSQDIDYVQEHIQNDELIEPNMDFLEYVDSEPDNEFNSSSDDEYDDYN